MTIYLMRQDIWLTTRPFTGIIEEKIRQHLTFELLVHNGNKTCMSLGPLCLLVLYLRALEFMPHYQEGAETRAKRVPKS